MTVTELAHAIGLGKSTVRQACQDGTLPALRVPGGHWRVNLDDLRTSERPEWRAVYFSIMRARVARLDESGK